MSSVSTRSRWRFLVAPKWLAWHAFAILASLGMLWLGDWQFHRAEGGNALSWAYTFEWPVFAVFGIVFWVKTLVDEGRPPRPAADGEDGPAAASAPGSVARLLHLAPAASVPSDDGTDEDDAELDEYNAYLSQLSRRPPVRQAPARPAPGSQAPGSQAPGSQAPGGAGRAHR